MSQKGENKQKEQIAARQISKNISGGTLKTRWLAQRRRVPSKPLPDQILPENLVSKSGGLRMMALRSRASNDPPTQISCILAASLTVSQEGDPDKHPNLLDLDVCPALRSNRTHTPDSAHPTHPAASLQRCYKDTTRKLAVVASL